MASGYLLALHDAGLISTDEWQRYDHEISLKSGVSEKTALKRIYPKADTSQLAAQESDAEAIKANCQVKIQLGTKDPNQ